MPTFSREMWKFVFCLIVIFFNICASCTINTLSGVITGKTVHFKHLSVFTFQGIPYAKPPLDELRFKKPVPIEPWKNPLKADHLPPGCIQHSSNPFPWLDNLPGQSEDCLYLNIWTPTDSSTTNLKSVLLFIHGGGFRISSSRLDYFDGRVLAALGDVIVVTTNYRLGPQGFLYSGTDDAPGNVGLYDILEALKWVHANIEAFGGNRHNITLFGQSAGAIAVSMFMTSPLFEGLFTRAILSSGSAVNLDAEDNDKDFNLSQALAEAVHCADNDTSLKNEPASVVQCLRGVDALELAKTVGKVSTDPQRSLYPRFGDEILPKNPRLSLINDNFMTVDVLIGNNKNEGSTMITKAWKDIFGFYGDKSHQINKTFGELIIRKNFKNVPFADEVVSHYLSDVDETDYEMILDQVQSASGDFARICPTVYLAEKVNENGGNVYYYTFEHRPSTSLFAPWMGVIHFDETPFVFGYPLRHPKNYTASELKLSRFMIKRWTNFAKSKNLRSSFENWPLYLKKTKTYYRIGSQENMDGYGPQDSNCDFFRKYFGLKMDD